MDGEVAMWPESVAFIERNFSDLPDAHREKVLSGNAARLYNLDA